jgi:hypothetical protein
MMKKDTHWALAMVGSMLQMQLLWRNRLPCSARVQMTVQRVVTGNARPLASATKIVRV